jgi:tetratricopeptide (TPR) repeat protein
MHFGKIPHISKGNLIFLFVPLFWSSCATVESSLNYTKGTEALEAGNYDAAITNLEKSVKLDPSTARNQNNLSAAYLAKGKIREGWPHIRKAIILAPRDRATQGNFGLYFKKLIDLGLVKEGLTQSVISQNLGAPDSTLERGKETLWQYGIVAIYFEKGRVSGFNHMKLR